MKAPAQWPALAIPMVRLISSATVILAFFSGGVRLPLAIVWLGHIVVEWAGACWRQEDDRWWRQVDRREQNELRNGRLPY